MNSIEKACALCGGPGKLAILLNVAGPTVHQWVAGVRPVPLERCAAIEKILNGAVTCEELRPDKAEYWAYLRGLVG